MLSRLFGRAVAAVALLVAAWGVGAVPDSALRLWIRPVGGPRGPVRILRFYATTGSIAPGGKAQLCYGVENAKTVRIAPSIAGVAPAANRCLDIVPDRTTHYTILAEGFDGHIVNRSLTLVVETAPTRPRGRTNMASVAPLGQQPLPLVAARWTMATSQHRAATKGSGHFLTSL
jgi:hypothetical protein